MKRLFQLIFICTFFIPAVVAAVPENLNKAIEEKVRALQEINTQIEKTQKEIDSAQIQQKTLKRELGNLNYGINQLNLSIKSSEIGIEKLNLELEVLQYDIQDTEITIQTKQLAVIKFLRELQQKDNESLLLAMLKKKSLADSFFELQSIDALNNQLSLEVKNLQQLQSKLQDKFNKRSVKKQQSVLENNNLKNRREIFTDQKSARVTLLSQTQNQEKIYQQQLSELEKKQRAISDEIGVIEDELRRTFDPSILPIKRPGVLGKPVAGPLSQEYGQTAVGRRLYKNGFHNGVDFQAAIGTPVFSAEGGEIIAVGNNGRLQYGKYVLINHPNNLTTLYAHLSRQQVNKGDFVKRGDLIGYSGNTGYSFGPHVHLTVYWAPSVRLENFPSCNCGLVPLGITINPLDYLERL